MSVAAASALFARHLELLGALALVACATVLIAGWVLALSSFGEYVRLLPERLPEMGEKYELNYLATVPGGWTDVLMSASSSRVQADPVLRPFASVMWACVLAPLGILVGLAVGTLFR